MTAKKKTTPLRNRKTGQFSDKLNFSAKEKHEVRYATKIANELYSKHWLGAEFHPKDKTEINVRTLVRLCSAVSKLALENKRLAAELKKATKKK